jgi:hypothetical protein
MVSSKCRNNSLFINAVENKKGHDENNDDSGFFMVRGKKAETDCVECVVSQPITS